MDVSAHKARTLLAAVPDRISARRLSLYTDLITEHAAATGTDIADIAAAMLALAVGDDGPQARAEQEQHEADARLAAAAAERAPRRTDAPRRGGDRRPDATGAATYRLAVGSRDDATPGAIVGALTGEGNLRGSDIGKINIFASFALVDITVPLDATALDKLSRARVAGRFLRIRPDSGHRTPRRTGEPPARTDRGRDRDRKPRHRHIAGN